MVNAQSRQTFVIKGTIINGLQLKSMPLTLADSSKKMITSVTSDSLGQFAFKDLPNGKYHLINKNYKLDSTFIINGHSIIPFIIELNACDIDASQAVVDIQHSNVKLLLAGGIAPVYYHGQETFEMKYKLKYYEYGCTPPDQTCMLAYNKVIFKYLDQQYGKRWRKEVRKDVIGYK
ncbi:hypothetical protein GCM10027037_33410 [Mucilaginibacter koreensis]